MGVPNGPLTVDEVKIEGNRLVPTEDIMGVVKTHPGDKFDRDKVMQDLKAINGLGYFDDRSLQVTPERSSSNMNGVLLKIRVQENAPVSDFAFQGNKVLSSEEISKVFSDQLGKPQNLNQLSSAIDKVEQAYHDKGFILARVTDVKDDPDGSIGLTINEGVINKIEIVGNHKTKEYVVRRYLKMPPGSVYNEKLVTADLRKLYGQGYFSDIRRSISPSATDPDKYTLKIDVDEKRSGSVGLGGGLDSMYGPFGSLSFSDANFQGKGQVLSFNGQMGLGMANQINNIVNNAGTNFLPTNFQTYNIEASFIEPHLMGSNTSMAVSGFGRDLPSYLISEAGQRTLGASVNFTRSLGGNFSASVGLMGSNTTMQELAGSNLPTLLNNMETRALSTGLASTSQQATNLANATRAAQLKGGTYASISPTIAYDTRDSKQDPTKGMIAKVTTSPNLGLGNPSYLKLGATVAKYTQINETTTLATGLSAGTGLGGMPAFGQYNLGGFNGIRGYRQFSDLGTGSSLLMASAEVRKHLPFLAHSDNKYAKMIDRHVKWDGFVDAGEVGGNGITNSLLSRSNVGASFGFGLRLNLPMLGVIRLDYGFPVLSSVMGGMTPRFTFGFGERF
jgi:outer membrane protein insertion porin family